MSYWFYESRRYNNIDYWTKLCYTSLCKIDILMITSMTEWAGNLIYCAFNRSDSRANVTVACKTNLKSKIATKYEIDQHTTKQYIRDITIKSGQKTFKLFFKKLQFL